MVKARLPRRWWVPYGAAAGVVALSVILLRPVSALHPGAASPVLLLAVLIIARTWGTGPALLASTSAALSYSYFFLPPIGFGFERLNDWVAFMMFTATAVIVGELAGRAKRRQLEAQAGRREIERLYQQLQAAFDRASEAEAARRNERLKAALLDALTHNLRTPLTAIKAAVTALIRVGGGDGSPGLSSEAERELLEVIDEESDRLNRFIEGLSSAGSVGDRLQPLNLPPVSLGEIIHSGLARAEPLTRDHRVVMAVGDGLPLVSVDAAAVAEVLYILLDNASKYAAPGTAIRIHAGLEDGRHVRVEVADEGPGIAPEYRERVFESFFRVPASRGPQPGGAGLGLSIARRLIEAQNGRMWIATPESGRGTAVAFTLPVAANVPAWATPAIAS